MRPELFTWRGGPCLTGDIDWCGQDALPKCKLNPLVEPKQETKRNRSEPPDQQRCLLSKAALFIPLAAFILLAFVLGAGFFLEDPHRLPSVLVGKPLPQFKLADVKDLERWAHSIRLVIHSA